MPCLVGTDDGKEIVNETFTGFSWKKVLKYSFAINQKEHSLLKIQQNLDRFSYKDLFEKCSRNWIDEIIVVRKTT